MGFDKPASKTEKKETELTSYESAQHKRFLRAEAEEIEVRDAAETHDMMDV